MQCYKLFIYLLFLLSCPTRADFYVAFDDRQTVHEPPHIHMGCQTHTHQSRHVNTPRLNTYSLSQLKDYFAQNHYTEKQILSLVDLYISDSFVTLAKTYQGYEQAIASHRRTFRKMSPLGKWWHTYIVGSYSTELEMRINQLYQEIHPEQKHPMYSNPPYDTHAHTHMYLHDEWMQHAALCYNQKTKNRFNKRINALNQDYTTHSPPMYVARDAYMFAQQYGINLDALHPRDCPAIALVLYQEYADILYAAAHIPTHHNEIVCDALVQASSIGLESNKAGFVKHAAALADFCWALLDYTQAVGEGICLGATNTLHTLTHPIDTAKNMLVGIGITTYALAKTIDILDFMSHAGFLYVIDNNQFYLKYNAIQDQLDTMRNHASAYISSTPTRDIVKQGAAFVTESILLSRVCGLVRDMSNHIAPIAKQCFKFIQKEEQLVCLANGEYIPIKMPIGMDISSWKSNVLKMEKSQLPAQVGNNILKNDFYEVNGFKFTHYYYDRLWQNGRTFPGFRAESIFNGATTIIEDPQGYPGFFKYIYDDWEMIFNPETRVVAHLSKIKILKHKG